YGGPGTAYSTGTKSVSNGGSPMPTVRCPAPLLSVTRRRSPGPKRRLAPLETVTSSTPRNGTTHCRCGARCGRTQSLRRRSARRPCRPAHGPQRDRQDRHVAHDAHALAPLDRPPQRLRFDTTSRRKRTPSSTHFLGARSSAPWAVRPALSSSSEVGVECKP